MENSLINYMLHLADNSLIHAQRNAEWCGHGPVLEQDIAITNISLDLLGQARNFYQYTASCIGGDTNEDQLAYHRSEREFKNCLLVEQPNGDWGQTILKIFLFAQFQYLYFEQLMQSKDEQLAAIAEKSIKETRYHLRWSKEWVIRLGDGTEESKKRMELGIENLWPFTGELFKSSKSEKEMIDKGIAPELNDLETGWQKAVAEVFAEAGLTIPQHVFMQKGGKEGIHSEHMGFILTELQYLQRAYPNSEW